jgi:DNA topoisomerase 2-associated protein PAT1
VILENLYDLVLEVEQLRRDQPPHNEEEAYQTWSVYLILLPSICLLMMSREMSYNDLVEQLWVGLRVMVPLETRYVPRSLPTIST